jgi:hypothetical protein
VSRILPVKALACLYFEHPMLYGSDDQNLQDVSYSWKKLLTSSTVVNDSIPLGHLTHGRLQRNAIKPQALHPSLPPTALRFQDLRVFGFGNAIPSAGLYQNFTINTPIIQRRGYFFSNLTAAAVGGVRDSNNRHND